jgi:hypothetical protein
MSVSWTLLNMFAWQTTSPPWDVYKIAGMKTASRKVSYIYVIFNLPQKQAKSLSSDPFVARTASLISCIF